MNKIFSLTIFCAFLFSSCVDPIGTKTPSEMDIPSVDSSHTMSVNNPLDPTPHAVKDSIYNGEHIEKYDNGVIYMRGDVAGGLRSGEWLSFYRSGAKWSQGTYKDGLRQGHGISWLENGNKSSEGEYKDDKPVGKWTYWDEFGNKVEKDFGGQ